MTPQLNELGSIAYGFIISYNQKPEYFPSFSRKDTLAAELTLDGVTNILKSAGLVVNFITDPQC